MHNESKYANHGNAGTVTTVERDIAKNPDAGKQSEKAPQPAIAEIADPAKQRQEKIKKLRAKLQQAVSRNSSASRKERNGQLFAWGAMVESIYRAGNAQERRQLRQWAKQRLTDHRHLKRAETGFARIEDEAAENEEASL